MHQEVPLCTSLLQRLLLLLPCERSRLALQLGPLQLIGKARRLRPGAVAFLGSVRSDQPACLALEHRRRATTRCGFPVKSIESFVQPVLLQGLLQHGQGCAQPMLLQEWLHCLQKFSLPQVACSGGARLMVLQVLL